MKNIKNILKNKITMVVLACLLLVGVFAGVTALATEGQPTLELVSITLNHEATPTLRYEVAIKGITENQVPALKNLTMKFWSEEPTDITGEAGDVATVTNGRVEDGNWNAEAGVYTVYFYSIGFSPKRMTDTLFASAVLTDDDGNVISQTAAKKYSVYEYLCELNFSGATADQQALVSAMTDYIKYAQEYLGWTESTKPSDLVYLKVNNGYFKISSDKGATYGAETYTSGTFTNGTVFSLHGNDKYDRFVNMYGYICDTHGDSIYYAGNLSGENRAYTALKGTKVTVKTADGAYLNEMTATAGGASYVYSKGTDSWRSLADGASTIICQNSPKYHRAYAFMAPMTNAAGAALVGWKDANDKVVSHSPVFMVDDLIDYTQEEVTLEYYPVYDTETADRVVNLNTGITLGGALDGTYEKNGNVIAKVENVFDGDVATSQILDNTGRTVYGDNPQGVMVNTVAGASTISMAHFSLTVKVDGRSSTGTLSDYVMQDGNENFYQIHLGYGSQQFLMFQLTGNVSKNSISTPVNNYYLNYVYDSNQGQRVKYNTDNAVLMNFGEENTIDMYIEYETAADGKYAIKVVHSFVNGNYAGSADVADKAAPTFNANDAIQLTTVVQARTACKVTYTDVVYYEYK